MKEVPLKYKYVILLVILALTFIVYLPSLNNDFTRWDDQHLVTENPLVHSISLQNFLAIIKQRTDIQPYIPLTIISYAIEYYLFKDNPFVYHLNNLLLHLCVVGLIFQLALKMKFNVITAGLGALIFGIHPVQLPG